MACLLSGIDRPYTSSCPYIEDPLRIRIDWGEVEFIAQREEVDMVYNIKSVYCFVSQCGHPAAGKVD